MAAPTLTNPPVSPSVSRPATFDAEADAHLAWQATNVTEMGTVNTWIEGQTAEVTDQADIATAQAVIAATQAGIATTQAGNAATQAGIATTQAGLSAASAASAANSPGTSATSTTSLSIGSGSKSLTIQTGKLFAVGQTVVIARTSDPTVQMTGAITAHNSGTGALSALIPVNGFAGSGTFTDWTISLSGVKGEKGDGSSLVRIARSSNTMLNASDNGKYFVCTLTFIQTFDTPANLGIGWFCYIKNAGTGNVVIGTYEMYPGEERRFDCDGTTINSIVITPFFITRTSSSIFYKPPGYSAFGGLIWGGGASGAASRTNNAENNGGGSAACTPIWYAFASMPASVSFTIGAGGTAVTAGSAASIAGNAGGNSTFGAFTAYGGVGGGLSNIACAGAGIYGTATSSGLFGGFPHGNSHVFANASYLANHDNGSTYGGGGGGNLTTSSGAFATRGGSAVYGGAGAAGCSGNGSGGYTTAGTAGVSIYGGTAGGGAYLTTGTTYVQTTVGVSTWGGTGGAANVGSGSRTGATGGVRGGGGGAAVSTDNTAAISGAGGRGELQLWGVL